MGYAYLLLWVESMVVSLLLVAMVTAFTARWAHRGLRAFVLVLTLLMGTSAYGAVAAVAWGMYHALPDLVWVLKGSAAMVGAFIVGTVFIFIRGLRMRNGFAWASAWALGRLAVAFLVTAWMLVTTLWLMELSIRQQGAIVRGEAVELRTSIAPPRVADADNAALDFNRASWALGGVADWPVEYKLKWVKLSDPNSVDANDSQLRAFLKSKADALRLARLAATKNGFCVEEPIQILITQCGVSESLDWAELIAGMLSVSARFRAAEGDANGAVEDINVILALGDGVGGGPKLFHNLVGQRIEEYAGQVLQVLADKGMFGAADLARIRVDGSASWQEKLQRTMLMEEAIELFVLADAAEAKTSPMWNLGWPGDVNRLAVMPYRVLALPVDIATHYAVFTRCRELYASPYWQSRAGIDELQKHFRDHMGGMITSVLMPSVDSPAKLAAEADAKRAVLSTAVAACRYRTAQGRWPGKIDDLVPQHMVVAPVDPFDGKGLRFKSDGDKIVIYSIGPDAVDDGGAAYDRRAKKGDIAFELRK